VVATELRIDGQRQPPARMRPALELKPGERNFAVEFAALDYSHPGRNRYRHRLEGFDADWIETRADFRLASYGNLAPGRYRLQVEGSNRVGDWSPHRLELPVQVHPAWWQTWWAQGGAVALVAALFFATLQLRTRLLRRRQAELEARVGERTHELEALSQALRRKSAELEASSLTDPLTGLHNRRYLGQRMAVDAAQQARRPTSPTAATSGEAGGTDLVFFLIDLDHFKRVNDQHGHAAGDQVLVEACARLKAAFREVDDVVRWGGEEILVAARGTDRRRAAEVAERALAAIAGRPFLLRDGSPIRLTASIGFAAHPLAPDWPSALDWTRSVDLADAALYIVKRGGRNGWYGLLQAEAADAQSLVLAASGPLGSWIAAGGLQVRASRPFEPG
jgi:diguanylate cyclase (GGDEF)-like protein